MRGIAQLLFWTSVLLLGYIYLGYPTLVCLWARFRPRPVSRGRLAPTVTLLVVVHNEAARIDARLTNLTSLDYPRHRLQILVASDGSTDATAERARAWEPGGVEVVAFEDHRGKPVALNDLMRRARGEIAVLADARQRFATDALRALVAPFADGRVGAVSGELVLTEDPDGDAVGDGVGLYWRYEKLIRRNESRVDSSIGATGAIYAIRRSLFEPIPEDTILDDVWLPMRIALRGYRVLFEPGARAWDRAPATAAEEFARKVRTLAGNFQLFARERWLLNPRRNRLWLETVSHKLLRLMTPFLLLTAFGANLLLVAGSSVHGWTLAAQVVFYMAALGGSRLRGRRKIRVFTVPYVICFLSLATLVALVRFIAGRQSVTWDKPFASGGEQLRTPGHTEALRAPLR
ncbi:MAG: glycosyltransferase family 2 protein [Candidatus Rokubacteria bacterium]|nr:glycosyltransferase family 2 protein [Candidatus Rokubacteria bacterium]